MTNFELSLCTFAVFCSSISQLIIKAASNRPAVGRCVLLLGVAATLMMCSVVSAVIALRTIFLSQLVSFAACAYVLVPLGGGVLFGERLLPRFWLGALLIVTGIICTTW